jgi:protein-disulfide isomerase
LIGEARAQAQPNLAIEPVSLPDMALGPRNAPVTIVDYSSMTCSHCAAFMTGVFPSLRSKYIDRGRVRFVFREFPLDVKAAAASTGAHHRKRRCRAIFRRHRRAVQAAGSADRADH